MLIGEERLMMMIVVATSVVLVDPRQRFHRMIMIMTFDMIAIGERETERERES